jgi:hypothetical protein
MWTKVRVRFNDPSLPKLNIAVVNLRGALAI